jgi:predicted nucleic acid-binding protein
VAVYFFDSSTIVKRYLHESGTSWVNSVTDLASAAQVYLARITVVEVISAITRKARGAGLLAPGAAIAIADFRRDFAEDYALVELTQSLIERVADLAEIHALRGYDAVQLAAALEVHLDRVSLGLPAITLISADAALNATAITEGLAVDDPNSHP